MSEPKISVIVPCFNASTTISVTLASLLTQTEKDLQIIVIDDYSSDHSVEIISRFAEKDSRVQYVVNPINIGVANTKNLGLSLALGKYISFLDADDWLHPLFLANLLITIEKQKVDFVRCDHVRVVKFRRSIYQAPQSKKYVRLLPRNSIGPASQKTMLDYPYAGTGIYRNDVLTELGICFQEDLRSAEDRLFFLRLFYESSSYCVSTESGYFYRKESPHTLTSNGDESQLHVFKAIKAMQDYCLENVEEFEIRLKVTEMSLALIRFHARNRTRLNTKVNAKFDIEIKAIKQTFDEKLVSRIIATSAHKRREELIKLFGVV